MASITLTVPDAVGTRVLDGYCYHNGYSDTIWDAEGANRITNPENKETFMKRNLLEKIIADVGNYEASKAAIDDVYAKIALT